MDWPRRKSEGMTATYGCLAFCSLRDAQAAAATPSGRSVRGERRGPCRNRMPFAYPSQSRNGAVRACWSARIGCSSDACLRCPGPRWSPRRECSCRSVRGSSSISSARKTWRTSLRQKCSAGTRSWYREIEMASVRRYQEVRGISKTDRFFISKPNSLILTACVPRVELEIHELSRVHSI